MEGGVRFSGGTSKENDGIESRKREVTQAGKQSTKREEGLAISRTEE